MNPTGSDVSNAVVALGTEGLQYYNAVAHNVFPTTTLATTPGGASVISASTGASTTIFLYVALAIAAAFLIWQIAK
jgi:hypothetical protein